MVVVVVVVVAWKSNRPHTFHLLLTNEMSALPAQMPGISDPTYTQHVLHQLSLKVSVVGECHGLVLFQLNMCYYDYKSMFELT